MNEHNANLTPQAAAAMPAMDDLSDTVELLDLGPTATTKAAKKATSKKSGKRNPAAKPTTKRGALLSQPSQTIDDAIAARVPTKKLEALLKEWGKYNLQQATIKAKEATASLATSIQDRRRHIADELLKVADGYGVSMAEAKNILAAALEAERSGKLK